MNTVEPLQKNYDVIIIGGGIVGMSVAFHLGKTDKSILVIDAEHHGKATYAGAGIISGATTFSDNELLYKLVMESSRYFPDFITEISRYTDKETGYHQNEQIIGVFDKKNISRFNTIVDRILRRQERNSYPPENMLIRLNKDQIEQDYPMLGQISHALYYSEAAQVDGKLLNNALIDGSIQLGVEVINDFVESLVFDGNICTGVKLNKYEIKADTVLITGGAWSTAFGEQLEYSIPVFPQRGQILHFKVSDQDLSELPIVISLADFYSLSWGTDKLVVGATRESNSGFNTSNTVDGLLSVLTEGKVMIPSLGSASLIETRVGLRPYSKDGIPIIGKIPKKDNIWILTGHGPLGLTTGPLTAKYIVDKMMNKIVKFDLDPYKPDRF